MSTQPLYALYEVKVVHRMFDWDIAFKYPAPNARTARRWALVKLAQPDQWLIVSAAMVKARS